MCWQPMTFLKHKAISVFPIAATAITVMLIVGAVYWPHPIPVTASRPLVHIRNCKVDLGQISQNANRDVSFAIENKGTRRLVLNEVGCGCGEPSRNTIVIQSGKAENVSVHVESQQELGDIERTLSFATNDESQPRIDLTVIAQVTEDQ